MSVRSRGALWALVATSSLMVGCGTSPEEGLLEGTYAAAIDPPVVGYATLNCDRLIPHVSLVVNAQGEFDLSIDVADDCSRAGGGIAPFEVLKLGTYARVGPTLSFTPDGEAGPTFTGQIEGEYIRLTLPAEFEELAPNDLEIRIGPRSPL